eukprot:CAMPEP_0197539204 /NCGR_PEP_ID=MMETSP1318-20131121/61941_1 /TAXON_ID=552666 /ORGANISM="Partenskyella glossopodia, Strain RCC365" /LENGTH=347 /DNA_ID=CAMNT_0043097847 /DNA_START=132 /DNA_END=1175 /DNA_ORIENTATION=-
MSNGDANLQTEYLANFRQDSIVKDSEALREALGAGKITLLGQSFGGFCILSYLSMFPESIETALFTVGLAPVNVPVDEVYRATYQRVKERNRRFYNRYPMDKARVRNIVKHLRNNDVKLPSGVRLTPRRFLSLGIGLGSLSGMESMHWLIEGAWDGDELAFAFLKHVESSQAFDTNPIYWLLHEAIYVDGSQKHTSTPSKWSADRIHREMMASDIPNLDYERDIYTDNNEEQPIYFTGEMVFPWFAEDYAELKDIKETAELLASKNDWGELYNIDKLKNTAVPCAALVSYEDLYVERQFSEETAAILGDNCKLWITNEHQHSGLRDDGYHVLAKLLQMVRGEINVPS